MTAKQQRFCEEYVVDLNGRQAAIRTGYSPASAEVQAYRLLTNVQVTAYIEQLKATMREKTGISAERVIGELAKIGFCNLQEYVSAGNMISDITTVTAEQGAAIASIKTTIVGSGKTMRKEVSIKLHDKVSALEKLGRHLGIFETDNRQKNAKIVVEIDE
jgi:phage terminase small subunit